MAITVYKGTDAGAPTFSNAAGSAVAIFDACLVNGYGAMAAAGWSIVYTGTNIRCYRAPAGNRFYLRVDDSAAGAATAAGRTQAVGFETMTDVNTGTNQFPSSAIANYGFCRRASTAGTVTSWILIASDRSFYWFPDYTTKVMHFFGDYVSNNGSFAYNTLLSGTQGTTTAATNYVEGITQTSNKYLMRNYSGIYSADVPYVHTYNSMAGSVIGTGTLEQINQMDNVYYMDAVGIKAGTTLYGYMPGLYTPLFTPWASVVTFTGTGAYAGSEFISIPLTSSGCAIIKTNGTWY
jgi:hypothetical protein